MQGKALYPESTLAGAATTLLRNVARPTSLLYRVKIALLILATLAACTGQPTDHTKAPSWMIQDTDTTFLAKSAAGMGASRPGLTGLYALSSGVEALGARLKLAERSERSIDVQYYYILEDITGGLLLDQLLKAADRGVRVRILLDDISTSGYEHKFAVLSAHENIHIRLTNPFRHRRWRGLDFLADAGRVDHRMHNKSITFDNAVTIVGGRNIAVEYFGDSAEFNYYDLDLLAVGDIATEVSRQFDRYWNAAETVPVTAFVSPDDNPASLRSLQEGFARVVEDARSTPYAGALHSALLDTHLDGDGARLVWAPARAVYDLPFGTVSDNGVAGPEVLGRLLNRIAASATQEFFLVSPYFVPEKEGLELFRELRDRGVRCVVVTNSLASTDVPAVYGGYRRYQKTLLELGVELWEIKAYPDTPGNLRGAPSERRSLHAKTFSVDRRQLFVGSFNWDPRSHRKNTEMGLLIDSPLLASQLGEDVSARLNDIAWRLRLGKGGEVQWGQRLADGSETVFDRPPQTTAWRRFSAWLQSERFIEGEL